MSDDLSQDVIPVKDGPVISKKNLPHEPKDDIGQQRRIVFKLPREELEDRFLRLCEDNMVLKTHSRKQEDKIKKMATKLIRLINDHKKHEQGGTQQGRRRDIETEELIEEMQEKIRELDRQNILLKEKLVAAKQQLVSHSKRISPCSYRYDSTKSFGATKTITKSTHDYLIVPQVDDDSERRLCRSGSPPRGWRDQTAEAYETAISNLRSQLNNAEERVESLKNQLTDKQTIYEEQLLELKTQVKQSQKQNVQENVELIKLQRVMKQSEEKMNTMMNKYKKLQDSSLSMKISHDQLVRELDNLTKQLKDEQSHSLNLQTELQKGVANHLVIAQLKEENEDLRKENRILKESNTKLMNSAFNVESEQLYRKSETTLQSHIAKLEKLLKTHLKESEILEQNLLEVSAERDRIKSESEHAYALLQDKYDELREKSEFLFGDEIVDSDDLAEAMDLLRQKRQNLNKCEHKMSSESEVEEKFNEKFEKQQYDLLQADHMITVNELDKIRTMLDLQCKINDDYKLEVDALSKKLLQVESELNACLRENARIIKLESATSQKLLKLSRQSSDVFVPQMEHFTPVINEDAKGATLIEIHMNNIVFTTDGYRIVGNEYTTFLTWSFYDFELVATKMVFGENPVYNSTAQYSVEIDDAFIHYITNEEMIVELQQAIGTDYRTVAVARVIFAGLFDSSHGRISGQVPIVGINNNETGIILGNLNFSIGVNPINLSLLRHFRERSQALNNVESSDSSNGVLQEKVIRSLNEISININQCKGLSSNRTGVHPSVYCMYKFYDWPDHDTKIVPFESNPHFNDRKMYQVMMDESIHQYLSNNSLLVYAFDDCDPNENSYIGVAFIPLFPLTQNSIIHDSFKFTTPDGSSMGTVDVTIRWQHPYTMMHETATEINQIQSPRVVTSKPPIPIPRKSKENAENNEKELIPDEQELIPLESSQSETISEPIKTNMELTENATYNEFDEETDENSTETDNGDVVIPRTNFPLEEKISIEICRLILFDNNRVIDDDYIRMLFVEYRFLDYPSEELETPYALPKPKANQPIAFNFHKEFKINAGSDAAKIKLLRNMLTTTKPEEEMIKFTLVSEPLEEEEDMECEDVAYGVISLKTIVNENRNLIDENITLYDIDDNKTPVGILTVSIEGLQFFKTIS